MTRMGNICGGKNSWQDGWSRTFVLLPSIIRVLTTSRGVVTAAATAPAAEPQTAPCVGVVSSPYWNSVSYFGGTLQDAGLLWDEGWHKTGRWASTGWA